MFFPYFNLYFPIYFMIIYFIIVNKIIYIYIDIIDIFRITDKY